MISRELETALLFFNLNENYTKEEIQTRYRELALKYHPDRGEFTSDTMFLQLIQCKSLLEENLQLKSETITEKKVSSDKSYEIYKTAKKLENDSILVYFKSRKKMPQVVLEESHNPEIIALRKKLEMCKLLYEKLVKEFPNSIWVSDAKDSLASIEVWWK